MKHSKTCPKCGSHDIVRFNGGIQAYGSGNYVKTSVFGTVPVNRYVCCRCGFCEEWIDSENLEKVRNSSEGIPVR